MGRPAERWFAISGSLRHSGHYRAVTFATVLTARLSGARVPFPRYLGPNDFAPVAAWIARRRAEGVSLAVYSSASMAVRIAAAAMELGWDIRGALFFTGGEALTAAKRAAVEAAGAGAVPVYWIHEIGPIGMACRRLAGNSVHHFRDSSAVIACPRPAPLSGVEVNSLAFTTLLPSSPRFLINAEMDDAGDLRESACDCAFSRASLGATIHDVFSYGKLTGHGMTLVGTDVLRVLEERMPARLGGRPGDYQLVEREGAAQTQIVLRVSPRVGLSSPTRARECFLEEIRGFVGGAVASRVWDHAGGVEVHIAEPYVTRSGKVLPLHLLGGSRA